jgi:hypothetical protein
LEALRGLPGWDDGDIHVVTPVGASSLETYIGWRDVWTSLVAGRCGLRVLLACGPRQSGMSSTIYNDESWQHGVAGLDDRHRMMDAHRVVAPSGVVLASTTCKARSMP